MAAPIDVGVLAYAASAIDCEGTIAICRTTTNHYPIHVKIANTDKRLTEWFQQHFGGQVTQYCGNGKQGDWSVWYIHAANAAEFLRLIRSHLLLKRAQADLALEYFEGEYAAGRTVRRGPQARVGPLSVSDVARRMEFWGRMRLLNARWPEKSVG